MSRFAKSQLNTDDALAELKNKVSDYSALPKNASQTEVEHFKKAVEHAAEATTQRAMQREAGTMLKQVKKGDLKPDEMIDALSERQAKVHEIFSGADLK